MKTMKRAGVLGIVLLIVMLPVASALQISNVRAEDITDVTADIKWETDEESKTFVDYGADKNNLNPVGDARIVIEHKFPLRELTPDTEYFFSVRSGEATDDNNGEFYSFNTLPPDTEPPEVNISIEEYYRESTVSIEGQAEVGSEIRLTINEQFVGLERADENGQFTFTNVHLIEGENAVKVSATDDAENVKEQEYHTIVDTERPILDIEDLPTLLTEGELIIKGTVSENAIVTISVNEREIYSEDVIEIEQSITLDEGENAVTITATDKAGWGSEFSATVIVDRTPPDVTATLEEGTNYYQGHAETTIRGTTEPGAVVYLYYFRPRAVVYTADFDRAHYSTTADSEGNFVFEDVNLERQQIQLEDLAPREVPQGLQEIEIQPVIDFEQQEQLQFTIYIIAEDKAGLVNYFQTTVTVSRCFSSAFDFRVKPLLNFQLPSRIDTDRLDSGVETITQIMNLTYKGMGISERGSDGRVLTPGYKINRVVVEKACTPGMEDDIGTKVSCKVMPSRPTRQQSNHDQSSWFLEWRLSASDVLSENDEDLWDDLRQRQMVFPYKMSINYQERDALGNYGDRKTQVFCGQFGYFVDIPADVANLVPDYIAEEGIAAINKTIEWIEWAVPKIEWALRIAAISCGVSIIGRTAVRLYRIFVSKLEPYWTKGDDPECPSDQENYYLKDNKVGPTIGLKGVLDDVCPTTAGAWKTEAYLDQAYRWTCNRVFCRASPAGWTEDKQESDINVHIQNANMCGGVTARGIPLERHENCIDKFQLDVAQFAGGLTEMRQKANICYRDPKGFLYYQSKDLPQQQFDPPRLFKLEPVGAVGPELGTIPRVPLIAYRPEGSEQFIVGEDVACQTKCKKAGKFRAVRPLYGSDFNSQEGCREEDEDGKITLSSSTREFSAGYTEDCFPTEGDPTIKQCVCEAETEEEPKKGFHEAEPGEEWIYRQERLYKESSGTKGTYYSPIRYYKVRDQAAAFGANHVFDYFRPGSEQIHEVNPISQHIGAFQTVCLSGIRGRLLLLQQILEGMRNCIYEAKYTGLQDAGMCKQLFSQYVCGLVYKVIAYAAKGCFPVNFEDAAKKVESEGAVEAIDAGVTGAVESLYETMDTSMTDLQEDYGNAKLNEYFAGGVEGITRSICLAAIGYDWPLGMDALMDAAYAVPMKTSVIPLAERELVSYDPTRQTAQFSYKVAATVFPGCKIRSYTTKLKCVGPEDMGQEGIDCEQQKCDCARISSEYQTREGREYLLLGGSGYDLQSGEVLDIPIQSPQLVNAPYRYDHVIVELELDQFEKSENCFDELHRDGKFYASIVDVSPRPRIECEASIQTGEYRCPDVAGFFGAFGAAYLEAPYVSCYNEREGEWMRCDMRNVLLKNDWLKIKPHIYTDGKGQCVHMSLQNANIPWEKDFKIPEGITNMFTPEFNIAQIDDSMFGAAVSNVILQQQGDSHRYCGQPTRLSQYNAPQVGTYTLTFNRMGSGFTLAPGAGVVVKDSTFNLGTSYSIDKFAQMQFQFGGFEVKNVGLVQDPGSNQFQCTYQVTAGTPGFATGGEQSKDIYLNVELRTPGPNGACDYATERMQSSIGLTSHRQRIRIQRSLTQVEEASQLDDLFTQRRYDMVISKANEIIFYDDQTLTDATAFYYAVLARVMKGKTQGDPAMYKQEILNLITQFNNRGYGSDVTQGDGRVDYHKMEKYLSGIKTALESGQSIPAPPAAAAAATD